jgi:3-deoxy-7-phosphoheptulonate synthase
MVITLEPGASPSVVDAVERMATRFPGVTPRTHHFEGVGQRLVEVHLLGHTHEVPTELFERLPGVLRVIRVSLKYRLIGRHAEDGSPVGFDYNGLRFDDRTLQILAGPCAVDSPEVLDEMFGALEREGIRTTRAGAYKPRTSPYDFQGLGAACLPWLFELAGSHGIRCVTMEVTDPRHVDEIHDALEKTGRPTGVLLQIGTRNTQNFELLKHVGRQTEYPVLFKRGMGITLEESFNACEYVASEGNFNIVFCLRGVKSGLAEPHRNLVDFAQVPVVRRKTRLPVCIDPSHSVGKASIAPDGLPDIFHAVGQGLVVGATIVLVEFHPRPELALCDGPQALTLDLLPRLRSYAEMVRSTYERAVEEHRGS